MKKLQRLTNKNLRLPTGLKKLNTIKSAKH